MRRFALVLALAAGGCDGTEVGVTAREVGERASADLVITYGEEGHQFVDAVASGRYGGGIYSAGRSNVFDTGGGYDLFLQTHSQTGEPWGFVEILGSGENYVLDLATDPWGAKVYLAGLTWDYSVRVCGTRIDDQDFERTGITWIARYDQDATCEQVVAFEPGADESLSIRGVSVDGAGDVVVVGVFTGSLDIGNTTSIVSRGWPTYASQTIFIAKYDADLALKWVKTYGETTVTSDRALQDVLDVSVDPTGNIHVTGWLRSRLRFGTQWYSALGTRSAYVAKIRPDGVHSWTRVFGEHAYGRKIFVADTGRMAIGGSFRDELTLGATTVVQDGEEASLYVGKISAGGTPQWLTDFDGTSGKLIGGVGIEHNGFVYATGYFRYGTFDTDGYDVSATSPKMFLAAFKATSSTTRWMRFFSGERALTMTMGVPGESYPPPPIVGGNWYGELSFDPEREIAYGHDAFVARFVP